MSKKSNAKLRDVLNREHLRQRGKDYFQPMLPLAEEDEYSDWQYGQYDEEDSDTPFWDDRYTR